MKIQNRYPFALRQLCQLLCLALLPLVATACLYEHPELTKDGELGIDPTEVVLKANLTLKLKMPASNEGTSALERPVVGTTPEYRHRFIIDAYLDRMFVARQVIYEDITDGRSELSIPVSLKLHACNYEIAVWSDYVQIPTTDKETTGTEEFFYSTATNYHLLTVLSSETYRGNNEYKDAFCGSAELDLTEYRDNWNAQVPLTLEMKRPVARYELVANDVGKFLKNIESKVVTGTSFTARLKYNNYLNVGYNVIEKLPRHGLMYMQYEKTFKITDVKAGENFSLAFDYLFAAEDVLTRVPVTLEIVDSNKKIVAATSFNVTGKAGQHTIITYGFLTADPNGGIDFDPSFDDETNIEVPAKPAN